MAQNSRSKDALPIPIREKFKELGERIRFARKRRTITMETMAARMFVTRNTLTRLENGDPTIGFHVVASALWVLGLENDLDKLADKRNDTIGFNISAQEIDNIKRVREKSPDVDMDF